MSTMNDRWRRRISTLTIYSFDNVFKVPPRKTACDSSPSVCRGGDTYLKREEKKMANVTTL